MLNRIGRAGGWWLAVAVVCAIGLSAFGVLAYAGRPHLNPDSAAAGPGRPAPRVAGASTATPAASASPTPAQAGLISSAPPLVPPPPPPRPSPSPIPSPSPVAPSPAPFLTLDPGSGAATLTPTWSASACPAGFQESAQVSEYTVSGTFISGISNVVATVASAFGGELLGNVGALLKFGGVSASSLGTLKWVVGCYSGVASTGAQKMAQSIYVTLAADGSYTTSVSPPG